MDSRKACQVLSRVGVLLLVVVLFLAGVSIGSNFVMAVIPVHAASLMITGSAADADPAEVRMTENAPQLAPRRDSLPGDHTWESTGDFSFGTFTNMQAISDSLRLFGLGGIYSPSGEYLSEVYDAGGLVDWTSLTYTATVPPSTTLTLYTRVGNAAAPDIHWSDWVTHTVPTMALPQPTARYAQFKVAMTTAVTNVTPILNAVTLAWDGFTYTPVEGSLDSDATWGVAGALYLLPENVVVRQGVTLTIEPGVTVWFSDSRKLLVEGTLIAQGTSTQAITFTTWHVKKFPNDWGNITFNPSSVDAAFDTNGQYLSGSILRYAVIEYAGSGSQVNGALQTSSAAPFIDHCSLRQNGTRGIYAAYSDGIRLTYNTITGCDSYGIYNYRGDEAIFSHNTLSDNNGTGIYNYSSYRVDISNNTLDNNSGSGIYNRYGDSSTMSRNVIANSQDAGIRNHGSLVNITYNSLRNNVASYGGGIRSEGVGVLMQGNRVRGAAGFDGGGIWSQGDSVTLLDNVISSTTTITNGGGIRTAGDNVHIGGNVISGTTASGNGGGIWSEGNSVTLRDNVITSTTALANANGGGICHDGANVQVVDNVVVGSVAIQGDGGGLWSAGEDATMSGNLFRFNEASSGGGLYHEGSHVSLSDNTIVGNSATLIAGGLSILGDDATVRDNSITHNTLNGSGAGGGLANFGGRAVIEANEIVYNTITGLGAGAGIWCDSFTATLRIDSNIIVSNTTAGTGGGLYSTGGDVQVTHNVITGNVAGDYGGLYWDANTGAIAYNIITTNTASSTGGIYVLAPGYPYAYPTIHHNNLKSNSGYALYNDSDYNGGAHLDARHNWWGAMDITVIDDLIYDFLDDADKSIVDFLPTLDSVAPDLRASTKTVASTRVAPGATVDYTLLLSNTTPSVARVVHLTDTLPVSVTYGGGLEQSSGSGGGAMYSATDHTIRWQGSLGPYETRAIAFSVAVPATLPIGTRIANTAVLWGDGLTETLYMTAIFTTASVPLQSVTIAGPAEGAIRTPYVFTAEASPAVVSPPLTYTWYIEPDGGTPIVHTGGISDSVTLTWFTAGTKTLCLVVANPVNTLTRTYSVVIEEPGVTIDGPALGIADLAYTFTARIGQMAPAAPITYTWETALYPPLITTQDTTSLTWAAGGAHVVTVTAFNGVSSVTDTHTIELYDDTQYTHLDGQTIVGKRRWTTTQSPYLLTGNVLVNEGAQLTIEPGVRVLFSGTHKIDVQGTLIAQGTAAQMIHFTDVTARQAPGAWQHIKFSASSADAAFDASGAYTGGSIIQYALLEYAGTDVDTGVIETDSAAPFVDHVTLRYNGARGIYNNGGTGMRITHNTLHDNAGDGINNVGEWAYIVDNMLFDNGEAGIRNSGPSALIQRNALRENAQGGINNEAIDVILSENTLTENTTPDYGGGICNTGSNVTLTHNVVMSNTARLGGGISNNGNDVLLRENTLTGNTATDDGGGIWSRGNNLLVQNNLINRNTGINGGGLHSEGEDAMFCDNTLRDNYANGDGGGAWSEGKANVYEDNLLYANYAMGDGGGLWRASVGPLTLHANIIANNTADGQGGGAYALSEDVEGGELSAITVTHNIITGNVADEYGGLYWGAEGGTIARNVIGTNEGSNVGGLYLHQGYPTLNHNNLTDNVGLALYNNNAYNDTQQVDAQFNWWGADDETTISSLIFDFSDDGSKSVVDYQHWLASGGPNLEASTKRVKPATASPGALITYTITLSNPTPSVARPVYLSDTLPLSTTYVSESSSEGVTYHSDQRTIFWQGDLGPYGERVVCIGARISPTVRIGARITNTAFLWGAGITGTYRITATCPIASIPVQHAEIIGPTRGRLYTSDSFTTTVGPDLAARPITYTWRVLETNATVTHTGDNISDMAVFTWHKPGLKTVQLVVTNPTGILTRTHVITVYTPPLVLAVDGPTLGVVGRAYAFLAQITPVTVTSPITYTWLVDDDPAIVTPQAVQTFTWGMPGHHSITVSATNAVGHITATHAFTIAEPTPVEDGENIVADTLWTASASPYLVKGNVLVNKNTRLTLEPGTVVLFDDQSRFEVQGTLVADGTATHPIYFTAEATREQVGAWENLYFDDASQDATFDAAGDYMDGSILRYVIVEYAGGGDAQGAVQTDQAAPFVDHCTIRHNRTRGLYNAGGYGMRIMHNTFTDNAGGIYNAGTSALLSDNTLTANATESWGGGIYNAAPNVTLRNNYIANNTGRQGGGLFNNIYGDYVLIVGNTLRDNHATSDGGGLYNAGSRVQIEHNHILGNISDANGGGLYNSGADVTLRYNTFTTNSACTGAGIYNASGSATISGNTLMHNTASNVCGGLYHDGYPWRVRQPSQATGSGSAVIAYNTVVSNTGAVAGGLYIAEGYPLIQYNSIYGNSAHALYNNNPYAGDTHLEVRHNWWGTTDKDIIKQCIYDWRADTGKSIVDYEPWLTSRQPDLHPSTKAVMPSRLHPGVSTTYITTLFNRAPTAAQTVWFTETLPSAATYLNGSLTAGGGYITATRTITWRGTVTSGEQKRIQFDVLLDPTMPIHTGDQRGILESTAFVRWKGVTETKRVQLSTALTTTAIMRVSAGEGEVEPWGDASAPAISADGWIVAFASSADNLVTDDTNGFMDIFVHDRRTRQVTWVSLATASENTAAIQADGPSDLPTLSADGRYIAFQSDAANLVADDTNNARDIFVHDRQTGTTTRVSLASDGTQADGDSSQPTISGDGRYVVFTSRATNLVADDTNEVPDIFLHDLQEGETRRLSLSSSGVQADGGSALPVISQDGRYVAFQSYAANLVPDDANGVTDIFVHDLQANRTTRVSVSSSRGEANRGSYRPAISADGQYVAFESAASNLVLGDSNGYPDIFVYNLANGQTTRASVASDGTQANGYAEHPAISGDGRYVAFASSASGLVRNDTNRARDIFVHDRDTSQTVRLSVTAEGADTDHPMEAHGESGDPVMSNDARYVAFTSRADDLVPGDTNDRTDIFVRDGGGEIVALPKIAVTPATLSFVAQAASLGGDDPAPQVLYLSRSGGGTLAYTLDSETNWLSLSAPSGTTPSRASVTVDIAGLQVGTYVGHVTARAPLAGNSPQPITVTLQITTEEVPTGDDYETDDTCAQAHAVAVNGAVQRHTFHQRADSDWVYFSGQAGTTYIIQATHTSPEVDLVVAIYDACDGSPSHSGDNAFGTDSRVVFEAPADGEYYVQIYNGDPGVYGADVSYEVSVRAPTQGGVAVIVAGHDAQKRVQSNIDNIANRAYMVFLNGGVSQDNITYLSHAPQDADGDGNDDTDGVATAASFEYAITTWAAERVDAETPFYLYMADHGGVDLFFTNGSEGEKTWADQLGDWLTILEQKTGATNVNVIIEACRSGSFIEGVKNISHPGRVIIASTGTQYNAYASRDGGIFSDAFLTALGSGYNLWESFQLATEAVEVTGYMQTPWLDDNGNAQQHAIDPADGDLARQRTLGGVDFGGLPPVIDTVSVTDLVGGVGVIRAEVRDDSAVDTVWAVIYPPTFQEPAPTDDGVMPELHLQTVLLLDGDGDGEYTAQYPGFTEHGSDSVIAYAEDNNDNQALPLRITTGASDKEHAVYLPLVLRQ